uniref:Uncharacterized protein n=1 Tax=Arundo donax TaxID=35708 RepID=A0A0A9BE82_ARUDO
MAAVGSSTHNSVYMQKNMYFKPIRKCFFHKSETPLRSRYLGIKPHTGPQSHIVRICCP